MNDEQSPELMDNRLRDLLRSQFATPELAYGTLPTARAVRSLELRRALGAEQTIEGSQGIASGEAFGEGGMIATEDVVEALKTGSLELPSLISLPSDAEVVDFANRAEDLLRQKALTQTDLLALSPRQFEELIAEIWTRFGYEVELTAQTKDGGKDIVAIRRTAEARLRFLIECKRYRPERKIGVAVVRGLYGVSISERATKAMLATTSSFSQDALRFISDNIWQLEGHDYRSVLDWAAIARQGSRS
jgi:hypothetical protein